MTGDIIQGYNQLPNKGELLIITASLKDALCLTAIGINAIAPQSENTTLSSSVIEELKTRFNKVFIMFDTDNAGIKNALKFSKLYNIPYLMLPNDNVGKDVADYKEKLTLQEFTFLINKTIENYDTVIQETQSEQS